MSDNDQERTVIGNPPVTISPDGTTLPIGTRMHEFVVEHMLGEGGFGVVYLARDTQLERTIAIKEYMPSSLAVRRRDQRITVRSDRHRETFQMGLRSFLNEARLLASFDHPSLLKVYRFWEANGTAYMAMPYYQGPTLKHWLLQHGPLDEEALRRLVAPLLDALQVLHEGHTFHRDIAPDNILLLGPERPVLLDFGAARRVIGDATQDLTVILKPGYAPIEQYAEMSTMKQGPWTDVYALCAVLYACVTGAAPPPSVARVVADEMKPARVAGAGRYGGELLAAIDTGLAVRPDQRPRDMTALRTLIFGPQDEAASAPPAFTSSMPAAFSPSTMQATSLPGEWDAPRTAAATQGLPPPAPPAAGDDPMAGLWPMTSMPSASAPALTPVPAHPFATPARTAADTAPAAPSDDTVVLGAAAEPAFGPAPPPGSDFAALDAGGDTPAPFFGDVAATRAEPGAQAWSGVATAAAEVHGAPADPFGTGQRAPARSRAALGIGLGALALAGAAWWLMGGAPPAPPAVAPQAGGAVAPQAGGAVAPAPSADTVVQRADAPAPASPTPAAVESPRPQPTPASPEPPAPAPTAVAAAPAPALTTAAPAPATAPAAPASLRPPFSVGTALDEILRGADPSIAVEVRTDQPRLVIGRDRFRFTVTSSIPGFVYVYLAGTDPSQFNLLFPNAIDRENRIEARRSLALPRKGWNITAGGPPGTDRLVVMVAPHARDFSAPGLLRISAEPIPAFDLKLASQVWDNAPAGINPYAGQAVCKADQPCDLRYGAQALELVEVAR